MHAQKKQYIKYVVKIWNVVQKKHQNMFGMITIAVSPKANQSKTACNADT